MLVRDIFAEAAKILGFCDEQEVFGRIEDAITVLANKGDWNPLIGLLDICACSDGNTLTLPREVDNPLAVNVNGHPLYFRNRWYEFHLNGEGSFSKEKNCGFTWDDSGFVPVFMDIIQPAYLLGLADLKTDKNKVLRIFGFDLHGKWIRTQEPDGKWFDGFVLPLNIPDDFPLGAIQPSDVRIFNRIFKPVDITVFQSPTAHQFVTGVTIQASLLNPPLPDPLINGGTYYIRRVSDTEVSLHNSITGALSNIDKVIITSAASSTQLLFSNKRIVRVLTKFNSVDPHNLKTAAIVEFTGTPLPDPIQPDTEYFVRVLDDNNFTVHETASDADTNTDPIDVITPGSGVIVQAKQYIAPKTKLTFQVNHNLIQNDIVRIVNSSGVVPTPLLEGVDYYVRVLTPKEITLHNSLADANNGTNPITLTSSGSGSNSVVKTIPCAISLGNASNCTAINHNLNQSGGDFIQFSTSGILPTPLTQNTAYRAEPPMSNDTLTINTVVAAPIDILDFGSGQHFLLISRVFKVGFTSQWETDATNLTTGTAVKIESDGSLPAANPALVPNTNYYVRKYDDGTIELFETQAWALDTLVRQTTTRSRTGNVATLTVIGHGFTTGDFVDVSSLGDVSYNGDRKQINVLDPDNFTYINPGADEAATADPDGQVKRSNIKVAGVGVGNVNLVIERPVTAVLDAPYFRALDTNYLADGSTVQFESDGSLPTPLVANTDYKIVFNQGLLQVKTLADVPVDITSIGSGNHTMAINRVFSIDIPDTVQVVNNVYDNGDEVTAQTTGVLPTPLIAQKYYLRRINDDEVQIYDTAAHAKDLNNNVGLIQLTDTGTGIHTFLQIKPAFQVKQITRVYKEASNGFINLYAWDYGRPEAMTLIGNYYPDETEPSYRRIKIPGCCSWARVQYKKRILKINSQDDFIPMTNRVSIIFALRALELARNNFFDEAEKSQAKAMEFLSDEFESQERPGSGMIQINDAIYNDPLGETMT